MNKLKRYLLFLVGLFINALGVSLVTKASLGTSPISSIPYVLSLHFPLTLGNFTIIFSILLILLQILILRKNFKMENILQIPVSIAFGYFIDLTMYLFFWVNPQNYAVKLIALVIGRQYGSGGHDIGKILADKLGFDFYDRDIIKMAAKTTGMTPEFIEKREETMTNSLIYDLVNQMYQYRDAKEVAPKDKIFDAESGVIRELADKGNCVIIGRCSDYVLKDDTRVLKVFFHAPIESRFFR